MAKVIPDIRDQIRLPSVGDVSSLDPAVGESPVVWRYTAWDLFGSKDKPSRGRFGSYGILGPGSEAAKQLVTMMERRIEKYSGARPAIVPDNTMGTYADPAYAQYLPGIFGYFGVPFHVTEAKQNLQSTGELVYHRSYTPSYTMRVRTELAIIRAGQSFLGLMIGLDGLQPGSTNRFAGHLTPTWDLGPQFEGGLCGSRSLQSAAMFMNASERGGGNWSVPEADNWLLKSISPTAAEWNDEWGAYLFFSRGGFLIDRNLAIGEHSLDYYDRSYNQSSRFNGRIFPCAVWARNQNKKSFVTSFVDGNSIVPEKIATPAGVPWCLAAASMPVPQDKIKGWAPYVDVLTKGRLYQLRIKPTFYNEGFDPTFGLVGLLGEAVRELCGHGDLLQKATIAAIEFAKLQGKTAQEAKAKAKTAKDVANAAELAGQYKQLALEIQIAAMAGSAFCGLVIPPNEIPTIDLPDVEPPPHSPKYDIKEMIEAIKLTGPLSLSPDVATSPTRWSLAAKAAMAIGGAALGAWAYQRKHK